VFHQLFSWLKDAAAEVAVETWLEITAQLDLVEVVLVLVHAVGSLLVVFDLLFGDILEAEVTLARIDMLNHGLLELSFPTWRYFGLLTDLANVPEVFIVVAQADSLAVHVYFRVASFCKLIV
jgi:hypothetical protein